MAGRITNLDQMDRACIRQAVTLAMTYWPNSHLGTVAPLEDMRAAFKMIRSHADYHFGDLYAGIGAVERDAYRHLDM